MNVWIQALLIVCSTIVIIFIALAILGVILEKNKKK